MYDVTLTYDTVPGRFDDQFTDQFLDRLQARIPAATASSPGDGLLTVDAAVDSHNPFNAARIVHVAAVSALHDLGYRATPLEATAYPGPEPVQSTRRLRRLINLRLLTRRH